MIHSNGGTSSNSSSSNSSESGYVLDTATTSLCNGHNNGSSTNADYGNSRKLIGWRGETKEWEAPHTFTVKMQLWEIWQTVQLKAVWRPMVNPCV